MKRIKILGLILVFLLGFNAFAQKRGYDLNWQSDFDQAKDVAKKENKIILIYFTSSDASTASKLLSEDLFYTEKFKKIAEEHLVLLRVNMPLRKNLISQFQRNTNEKLSKKYDQKVIPTVVLTDANGKSIGMVESYNFLHDTSKHYALINKALKRRN